VISGPTERRYTPPMPVRTEIVQVADVAALADRACERVLAAAAEAIAARGAFRIALSGGKTPLHLYERLARREAEVDAARWHVYFGDERCVPADHRDSNYGAARDAWLASSSVPARQIHRMRGELAPEDAAASYERELRETFATREAPRFDVILLGIGEDGHTASLFPGSGALAEARRLVTATYVAELDSHRVTLTLRTINATRCALFLVAGEEKSSALRAILHGEPPEPLPAARVAPWEGTVEWIVDRAAASRLAE
jgi:6-phosphogluconolactonase